MGILQKWFSNDYRLLFSFNCFLDGNRVSGKNKSYEAKQTHVKIQICQMNLSKLLNVPESQYLTHVKERLTGRVRDRKSCLADSSPSVNGSFPTDDLILRLSFHYLSLLSCKIIK